MSKHALNGSEISIFCSPKQSRAVVEPDVVEVQSAVQKCVKLLTGLGEGVEVGTAQLPSDHVEQLIGEALKGHGYVRPAA
jgi:hypothetical protein